jgi:arabinofuranan 3-O-arabinosyltransferase
MASGELDRRERGALVVASVAIATVVFAQAPGRILPETKLDVSIDPVGYLARALTAWDPSGGFGRVQNQAIGYLFPMGAFSAALRGLGVPPWIVQRAWISLVVLAGLWGAHRLASLLGLASARGRVVAALAYALSPATLSLAAFQSAGQVPYSLVPWVLVPLLSFDTGRRGTQRLGAESAQILRAGGDPGDPGGGGPPTPTRRASGSARRAAAWSGLAVVAMGGVNGASNLAVLVLPVLWLATRHPGAGRRRLGWWWTAAVVLATVWWAVPLLVSVRYGVRFTDYTEPASLTTLTESATEVLRGTGNWLSFLRTPSTGAWLPGGWALSADRLAIVGSVAVAAAGLGGLTRRDLPERRWLVSSAVIGAVLIGAGYGGPWGGSFHGVVQDLLDGPLVPFRNVHKFSAVLRLPLAIGFGHLVASWGAGARAATPADGVGTELRAGRARWAAAPSGAAAALAVAAVLVAVLPAAGGDLSAPGSFRDLPASWRAAARWLDAHDDGRRSLLLPGSSFGEYVWGRPLDEPLSTLLEGNWAVRDLVPLGGNGSTRLLDGIDAALAGDTLPPGFVATLQRAGVGFLVVRNDLDLARTGGPRPASVRRLLTQAPELELVRSFGPQRQDPGADARIAPRPGAADADRFAEIDVYRVPSVPSPVAAYPAEGALVVSGGPEAMLQLPPSLVDGRAAVLAVDARDGGLPGAMRDGVGVATDTARRRGVVFGAIRNNVTWTLRAGEPSPLTGEPPLDRWPGDGPFGLTVAETTGVAGLGDSRAHEDRVPPSAQPFAAFDGNPLTVWAPAHPEGSPWLEVTLGHPRPVASLTVRLPEPRGRRIGSITVTTDGGEVRAAIGPSGTARVALGSTPTSRVRITVASVVDGPLVSPVGLAEVRLAGLDVGRPLVVPDTGATEVGALVVSRERSDRYDLVRRDEDGVLDRIFPWGVSGPVALTGTAVPVPGDELDALVGRSIPDTTSDDLVATASSTWRGRPEFAARWAFDGDPATAWVSDASPGAPHLTVSWRGAEAIDSLTVVPAAGGTEVPREVDVTLGATTVRRALDASGRVSVPLTVTDRIDLSFPRGPGGAVEGSTVGIAEIEVPALLGRRAPVPSADARVALPCGRGPALEVDGVAVPTRVDTTIGALLGRGTVVWHACDRPRLDAGRHRITGDPGGPVALDSVLGEAGALPKAGGVTTGGARSVSVEDWGREHRRVRVGPGPATVLATTENENAGWEATLDGRRLESVRIDGWRQGWVVPEGQAGVVVLRYRPGRAQRVALALGGIGVASLLWLAAWPPGRLRRRRGPRQRSRTDADAVALAAPDDRRRIDADSARSDPTAGASDPPEHPARRIDADSAPTVAAPDRVARWLAPLLSVAAAVALAGPLLGFVAIGLVVAARRHRGAVAIGAVVSFTAAGLVVLAQPGALTGTGRGTFSGSAQILATFAISALAATLDRPEAAPEVREVREA